MLLVYIKDIDIETQLNIFTLNSSTIASMNQIFSQNIWLIPCYALIGATLALCWSPGIIRNTGSRPAGYINIIVTCVAFIHSIFALIEVWQQPVQEIRFPWLTFGSSLCRRLYGNGLGLGEILCFDGLF